MRMDIYDDYVYYVLAAVISAIFPTKKWKVKVHIYDDDDDGVSENENPV